MRRDRGAASRLVASGLWLSAMTTFMAVAPYLLDAAYVALIELSVGAGLLAVLVVFAVTTAGDEGGRAVPGVSRWLATGLVTLALALVGPAIGPSARPPTTIADATRKGVRHQLF
jgi:NADH:ubiquinone oxidoreductase subunit 6 (subunit J)